MLTQNNFQKLPIFIISMSRWDGDVSSASLALAKVLSRTNPVYYIDYPYSWADVWRGRNNPAVKRRMPALLYGKNYLINVTGQPASLQGATPKPGLPIFSLPPGRLYNIGSHYNNHRIANLIKKIIREKKIRNYILINSFNPSYLSVLQKYLNPALSVYHSRDAIEEIKSSWLPKENECVQHYDMAMATSKQLCRNISARNNKLVNYFPNGGDIQLFRTAFEKSLPRPAELAHIATPIIGYTGAVCQRVDYELLEKIAHENPDKTIVLVGPRQDKQYTSINLDAIPNIVFTGPKKIDQLPAYLHCFDCAIIPFVKNNFTGGIYPLKINEYLGAGRAVVTTHFSEDIASFKDDVYMAENHEEFLKMINKAIWDNCLEKRQHRLQVAEGNSWEHRAALFWQLAWTAYEKKHRQKIKS
ncbi:MAG: hypothetical protein JWR61_787 [Ferruginibacter sp.]|uniref:glycosyltransferase n=1 Tax=Ferruginibacter sp. TaxID=1940288 RepID=UPI00265A0145|nr:glycosyltransferase [Ferruginibacter sp.]MDB5275832.1 hypothetical protein [Ferruginibacter sp.]